MIKAFNCVALSVALEKLGELAEEDKARGMRTIIFCEDRLTLAAERAVCSAVGGTFSARVFTFARYLSLYGDRNLKVLSSQGSAMAIRKIIDESKDDFILFKRLSGADTAKNVYDTIALLYASAISPDDIRGIPAEGIFASKLHDIEIIYSKYEQYLEENMYEDRNNYLRKLDSVIRSRNSDMHDTRVIFLGYQAFTKTGEGCIEACFDTARDVAGIFIGGNEEFYVNEACTTFIGLAKKRHMECERVDVPITLMESPDVLRRRIFNPESYILKDEEKSKAGDNVLVLEAQDSSEELEFIAAEIKRLVHKEGFRYGKISVMLPDLENSERDLSRIFAEYRIPYYADRKYALSTHPLCSFVMSFLQCLFYGCRAGDVEDVVASPFFSKDRQGHPVTRDEKDTFRNYMLRFGGYRGAVNTVPDKSVCEDSGYGYDEIMHVRQAFLDGYSLLKSHAKTSRYEGVKAVLEMYGAAEKAEEISGQFADKYPAEAEFSHRACPSILQVLSEAESVTYDLNDTDYLKVIKSGFSAMKISLIPPKADAVFVGDISATANTGSEVVFCARLTSAVPSVQTDSALLSDKDLVYLESHAIAVAPKIKQINMRSRETTALNVCSFRRRLILSYPARLGAEESTPSEIISYATSIFLNDDGTKLVPVRISDYNEGRESMRYYCSETLPAMKWAVSARSGVDRDKVLDLLRRHGKEEEAAMAAEWADQASAEKKDIDCGEGLYFAGGSISPTTLETYFSCPYKAFMQNGLGAKEREEGGLRARDSGNFIHEVLQKVTPRLNDTYSLPDFLHQVSEVSDELFSKAPYSALNLTKSGQYTAQKLREEVAEIASGLYEQVKNSAFKISGAESRCEIVLSGDTKVAGRIDRIDIHEGLDGDMVRVVDYKTGNFDATAKAYYMGRKLQLELYLEAASASNGARPVAAYYFPAQVGYKSDQDGVFRMAGFMDASQEVVQASDITVESGEKSKYFDAYLADKQRSDSAMLEAVFPDFLDYSVLVADKGAREMKSGYIKPSPVGNACTGCKYGGSCGFGSERGSAPRTAPKSVKCMDIAQIAQETRKKAAAANPAAGPSGLDAPLLSLGLSETPLQVQGSVSAAGGKDGPDDSYEDDFDDDYAGTLGSLGGE
ncbi:MAG: PD-(D/E)XK nuclease family protein [Clostridia bacterium]|nr:PD-(D/E)XK nuclease family protein [Clostridia bacterium]